MTTPALNRPGWRLWTAPVAASVVMMAWGFAFWGFLYEPVGVFQDHGPGFEAVAEAIAKSDIETGTYFHPWPRNTPEAEERWVKLHATGPFFKLGFVREGVDPTNPIKMLSGFLLYLAIAIAATIVLRLASVKGIAKATLLITLAGAIGSLYANLADPVWFHLPSDYPLGALLFELVQWFLMGLTLVLVLGRSPQSV